MELVTVLIQGVAGIVGGNAIGAVRAISQRTAGNTALGILGGILGGQLINLLGFGIGPLDSHSMLTNIAAGGAGGGALVLFVGAMRAMLAKEYE